MALIDDALRRERRGEPTTDFFSGRRRFFGLLCLSFFLAGCGCLAVAFWRIPHKSADRRPPEAEAAVLSAADQLRVLTVQGVQVGPYETKALIDGRLVRQGERIGQLIFLGMRGKELAFEDGAGERHYRPICPGDGHD
ncbi:MAG: hypothetical protein LBB14_01085 [Puniceicoccales bacterium]|jgi:hypothetical protein|nr:hypothetical protein [Puniceicoccales bacterium]